MSITQKLRFSTILTSVVCLQALTTLSACSGDFTQSILYRDKTANAPRPADMTRRVPIMNPGGHNEKLAPQSAIAPTTPRMQATAPAAPTSPTPYDSYAADGSEIETKEAPKATAQAMPVPAPAPIPVAETEEVAPNQESWTDKWFGWAKAKPADQTVQASTAVPLPAERKPVASNPTAPAIAEKLPVMEKEKSTEVTTAVKEQRDMVLAPLPEQPAPVEASKLVEATPPAPQEQEVATKETNSPSTGFGWFERLFSGNQPEEVSTTQNTVEESTTTLAMSDAPSEKKEAFPTLSDTPPQPTRFNEIKNEKSSLQQDLENSRKQAEEEKSKLNAEPSEVAPAIKPTSTLTPVPLPVETTQETEQTEVLAEISAPPFMQPPVTAEQPIAKASEAVAPVQHPPIKEMAAPIEQPAQEQVLMHAPKLIAESPATPVAIPAEEKTLKKVKLETIAKEDAPVEAQDAPLAMAEITPAQAIAAAQEASPSAQEAPEAPAISAASIPSVHSNAPQLPNSRYSLRRHMLNEKRASF